MLIPIEMATQSLLGQSMRAIWRHVKELLPRAAIFFIPFFMLGFYFVRFAGAPLVTLSQLNKWQVLSVTQGLFAGKYTYDVSDLVTGASLWLLQALVLWLQTFYFTVFFSRRELTIGQPKLNISRFLYATAIMFICFSVWQIMEIITFVIIRTLSDRMDSIAYLSGIEGLFSIFLLVRFLPILPLVSNNIQSVFKTAWTLSKHNWWRLFGNLILFEVVVLILAGVPSILLLHLMPLPHDPTNVGFQLCTPMSMFCMSLSSRPTGIASQLLVAMGWACQIVFSILADTAFFCVATRILNNEKRLVRAGI